MIIPRTESKTVPAGVYDATIIEANEADGEYGPQVAFRFDLGDQQILRAWASAKMSSRSKLGGWTLAILGAMPEENLDTSTLVGKRCRVKVEIEEGEKGAFSKVVDVLTPRKVKPAQADVCSVCGAGVELYTMDGVPRCFAHAKETEPENVPF